MKEAKEAVKNYPRHNLVRHDIDWSKSHNGVMLCSFEETARLMPEVIPIINELLFYDMLELDPEDYAIDVKIHMLMPGQFPCIPNWHRDFMPRNEDNEQTPAEESPLKMYMWLSGGPLTEYRDPVKGKYQKEAQKWHTFTQSDWHRGVASTEHTWRCFIRVIPKQFIHPCTKNVGTLRRHTQVYLDSKRFKW